jgi:uncharacterized membrane-anchored protein
VTTHPRPTSPVRRRAPAGPKDARRPRPATGTETAVTGTARIGRRTKELIKRLQPGEIAVIDHADLDRLAADGLIESGVAAVVNASGSISGRYPNGGPLRLVRSGVVLIDDAGVDVLEVISEGDRITIDEGRIYRADEQVASGALLDEDEILRLMDAAQAGIGEELEAFAVNTLEYIRREATLTFAPLTLPPLRTSFVGRHVLIVVRGNDYKDDLQSLRPYIREYRPVLVAVDGGADALLEQGLKPHVIVGDFDSVSARAMACGAEHVHHVHPDGRAPGWEELQAFGRDYEEFVVEGTSEDAAMLLAYEAGARLIVAVGTHSTMVEFLDKGRRGMSSTFLTRLRLGPMLIDAKGVTRLYESSIRKRDLGLLVLAAFIAMVAIAMVSEPLQVFLDGIWLSVRDLWFNLTENL